MPEGDSVWRAARRLHTGLAGRVVQRAELRWPDLAAADLRGWRTREVVPHGKHLLHRFDNGMTLHSHLRMDGRWEVRTDPVARPADRSPVRAWLVTDQVTALGRRLGMLHLVRTADEDAVVGPLGPDVLASDWQPQPALRALLTDQRAVGEALLDQQVLAGLGTMWVSEVLFARRVHPWQPSTAVGAVEIEAILALARRWLWRSKDQRISTSTGDLGRGAMRVHARSGRPCVRCGDRVRVAMIGQPPYDRTMFYCPSCQGGLAPGDDGRVQAPLGSRPPLSFGGPGSRR